MPTPISWKLYLQTFSITAPVLGVFYHVITMGGPYPMNWWPDTVIMGAFTGFIVSFALWRATFVVTFYRHLGRTMRAFWRALP